jgi:hypothetical protein
MAPQAALMACSKSGNFERPVLSTSVNQAIDPSIAGNTWLTAPSMDFRPSSVKASVMAWIRELDEK